MKTTWWAPVEDIYLKGRRGVDGIEETEAELEAVNDDDAMIDDQLRGTAIDLICIRVSSISYCL